MIISLGKCAIEAISYFQLLILKMMHKQLYIKIVLEIHIYNLVNNIVYHERWFKMRLQCVTVK